MAESVLDNADRALTPGLFARVQLVGIQPEPSLMIDDKAVLTDQDRKYVYVLSQRNTAERKNVVLGGMVNGLRIVESGLAAEDQVVVNGVQKTFFSGMPLDATHLESPAPAVATVASAH